MRLSKTIMPNLKENITDVFWMSPTILVKIIILWDPAFPLPHIYSVSMVSLSQQR